MPTVAMTSVSAAVTAPRACSSRAASGSKLTFHQRCKTETHAIRFASRRSSRVEIGRANGDARCKAAGTNRVALSVEASASTKVIVQGRHLEITEAIHAKRPAACETQGELLSYLLGVAVGACNVLDADVHPSHFVAARDALQELKEALKEIYTEVCIPY